ncbi:MAG: T9SS type A sorting domain-containing protein [Candidatus Eisenbacteria bacterium]|uniref:T9SS type A sorting domain-containing protein n=1 Tax=Eiseniibacteriota bacterium TaxID=2212470 RepID=A0A956SGJ6_UNCEI|nr:T9SS type A sorting domain-containing protein [Candidatus Eisenbacteria bacterium]
MRSATLTAAFLLVPVCAMAGPNARSIATAFDSEAPMIIEAPSLDGLVQARENTPLDFIDAWTEGAEYLRYMQADVTDDNAGNGTDGVDESPDDPDDGGWDWSTTTFSHSTGASPTNIYGACALGLYYARENAGSPPAEWAIAMTDAADAMVANPSIRSSSDMIYLLRFADVASDMTYADAARTKYDGRITTYGSATALAEYIRDARAGQGYENGIIAWDVGTFAQIAAELDAKYPGNGYAADAVAIAEVLYQDSFADNPGYFDIVDDAGFDPTYTDKNYWWYNLGISGLIRAFQFSGAHTGEIPGLVDLLLDGQYSYGGVSFSYGANVDDWDWQSTAYAALALADVDLGLYETEISNMAYWLSATQDQTSGAWIYGSGTHYPEIGGENTAAMSFGNPSAVTLTGVNGDATGFCLSSVSTCVTVPFTLVRGAGDIEEARGVSVTIQISPELELCGSITQGDWLDGYSDQYFVTNNGGGNYTIDQAILGGTSCETGGGLLFEVPVQKASGVVADALGSIEIEEVLLRNCVNQPIAAEMGALVEIPINIEIPAALASLAASQVTSGNPTQATTNVDVSFTAPSESDVVAVHVYRAPYGLGDVTGSYPEYDDEAGSAAPTAPSWPPGDPWVWVADALSGPVVDNIADRGYWYYVAFVEDECGNVSPASNLTTGTLNYHLGDVTDGASAPGDNLVDTADMSKLGANYGIAIAHNATNNDLDVGPTSDFSVTGFPLTDNLINFEDLILFAINYGLVSLNDLPQDAADLTDPSALPSLTLEKPARSLNGTARARLVLDQPVDLVQGVHAVIEFDPSQVEIVGVRRGDLLGNEFFGTIDAEGAVSIDAAALGTGATIQGSGAYAVVEYRPLTPRAGIELGEVSLRDVRNRDLLKLDLSDTGRAPDFAIDETQSLGRVGVPETTQLLGARPNPFATTTDIHFQLAQEADVRLEIFDVAGRLVRTVFSGRVAAGEHAVTWDGRMDSGASAGSGIYLYRLQAGGKVWGQKLFVSR